MLVLHLIRYVNGQWWSVSYLKYIPDSSKKNCMVVCLQMLTTWYYCLSPTDCVSIGRRRRESLARLIFLLVFLCFTCSAFIAGLLMSVLPTVLSASPQAAACYYLFLYWVSCLACCLFLNLHTSSATAYPLLIETSWWRVLLHQQTVRTLNSAIHDSSLIKSVTWNKCTKNIKEMLDANIFF